MMICNADFDELFPATARAGDRATPAPGSRSPDQTCLARWEDDGGRTRPVRPPRSRRSALPAGFGRARPDPVRAGMAFAMLPVLIASGVTSAMLAAQGGQTRA